MNDVDSSHVLIEAFSVASVAAASYASTNFDNLVVVAAYAAKSEFRPVFLKITFVLVCLAVLLLSLGLAHAADALPAAKIRYLGVIPMGLGVYHLAKLIFGRFSAEDSRLDERPGLVGLAGYLGFVLALFANSGDSVIVLAPLLADLKPVFVLACFGAALAVTVMMSSLADFLASHSTWRSYVERISNWALPFLLIGIGILILTDIPTDVFVE